MIVFGVILLVFGGILTGFGAYAAIQGELWMVSVAIDLAGTWEAADTLYRLMDASLYVGLGLLVLGLILVILGATMKKKQKPAYGGYAAPLPGWQCGVCGAGNAQESFYCCHCGSARTPAAPASPRCPRCGATAPEPNQRFCQACGAPMQPEPQPTVPQPTEPQPPEPSPGAGGGEAPAFKSTFGKKPGDRF